MTAIAENGQWFVVANRDKLAGPFPDSASAWRWIERHEGEPVSASEKRAEFGLSQSTKGFGS